MIRRSMLAAGLMLAAAAVPFSQIMATQESPSMQKSSKNRTLPDKAASAWITTKGKSEFRTTKHISVNTADGMITLSVTVATFKLNKHGVHMAMKIKGAKSVNVSGLTVAAKPGSI